jgi:hypothetical protein
VGKIFQLCKEVLFAIVFILLLFETVVLVYIFSWDYQDIIIFLLFFLLTITRPFWGVFVFVAMTPLVNGLFLQKGFVEPTIIFNAVFLGWFLQRVRRKSRVEIETNTTYLTYLLAFIVVLNFGLAVSRMIEYPVPSRYWLEWFVHFPIASQMEPLWQLNAALILLKGLILFLLVHSEIKDQQSWEIFSKALIIQAVIVVGFALWQLAFFNKSKIEFIGLSLPFNDIHSYGSAVALFCIVVTLYSKSIYDYYRFGGSSGFSVLKNKYTVVLSFLLAALLLGICIYSASRMTWLTVTLFMFLIFFQKNRVRRYWAVFASLMLALIVLGSFAAPQFLTSENKALYRLGTLLNVKNILNDHALSVRFELWERSWKMVKEVPLTGTGIGNVYRNIHLFKDRSVDHWDNENSHNYYLQLAAELGVPGLILFILIMYSVFFSREGPRNSTTISFPESKDLKPFQFGIAAYLLTMLSSHPLLLATQQFIFWPVVALLSKGKHISLSDCKNRPVEKLVLGKIGFVFFIVFVAAFTVNAYKKEPWTIPFTYGIYGKEDWSGVEMRWISGRAMFCVPSDRKRLTLRVVAQPYNSTKPEGLTVQIFINDDLADTLRFLEGGSKIVSLSINQNDGYDAKVSFEVDRAFIPIKLGINQDSRLLAVAIGEMEGLLIVPPIQVLLKEQNVP